VVFAGETARAIALHQAYGQTVRQGTAATRAFFGAFAALADTAAIVLTALTIGAAYHYLFFGEAPVWEFHLQIGVTIALFMLAPNLVRHEYAIANYLTLDGHMRRLFPLWNMAFAGAIVLSFIAKTTDIYSRGTVAIVYIGGLITLSLTRWLLVRLVQISAKTGTVSARRLYLVGDEDAIAAFATRHQPWNLGMQIAGVGLVPRHATPEEERQALANAVAMARTIAPDDVFVFIPWDRRPLIEACIDAFLTIPASIHLGAEPVLDRFHDVRISRVGTVASMQLVRRPLSTTDIALKRLFDIALSAGGLVLLSPLFAAIAIMIRRDSEGPALFRQRRFGFNQQPFQIYKFRTMRTMDDGAVVPQATRDDPRITRIGRVLRRWNLDELPQLINVLKGEMSLVGPRPHALAHDEDYQRRLALYARRHNVRPGITGWAQVNGFRGETDTDAKMQARLEHDLHYIDNWSIWLDIKILVLTVLSPRAYRNAV
jgi:Undecaprenyl-phosphate glucose phosphotransferase